MAALYSGGPGRAQKSFSRITAYPFTMFCRAYAADTTGIHTPFQYSVIPASGDRSMALTMRGDETGDLIKFRKANGSSDSADSPSGYTANTWTSIGGSATNATSARVFVDGVRTNGPATSITFPTPSGSVLALGHLIFNGTFFSMAGGACAFAMWDVELTDDEHIWLGKGGSPRRIRPQSLVFYAPFVRDDQDLVNGGTWSYPGGALVVTPNPRSYGF